MYHVMNRGDRREAIFADDEDRERLLPTLTEACQKTGWQVQAYCLMRNHFHLVIETPQPNLVVGMKWLLGTYTMTLLGEWGIPKDSAAGRRVFAERMEWRRREDLRGEFKRVERGWCLGGEEFRQELLEQVDARPGPSHFGEAVQEAEAAQAERLVVEGLKRMGWSEADLSARRKGERGKVQLARELRSNTTMPLAWIAARLNMGSRGHLAWLLQGRGRGRRAAPTDQCLLQM
jgi:REP element-mobilizing transposase RayT/ribosomal protein L39E